MLGMAIRGRREVVMLYFSTGQPIAPRDAFLDRRSE
jgi:hypothetical protein